MNPSRLLQHLTDFRHGVDGFGGSTSSLDKFIVLVREGSFGQARSHEEIFRKLPTPLRDAIEILSDDHAENIECRQLERMEKVKELQGLLRYSRIRRDHFQAEVDELTGSIKDLEAELASVEQIYATTEESMRLIR